MTRGCWTARMRPAHTWRRRRAGGSRTRAGRIVVEGFARRRPSDPAAEWHGSAWLTPWLTKGGLLHRQCHSRLCFVFQLVIGLRGRTIADTCSYSATFLVGVTRVADIL